MTQNSHRFNITYPSQKSYHIASSQGYLTRNLEDATILNLDEYLKKNDKYNDFNQKEYDEFKNFNKEIGNKLKTEIDNNTGEIIECHIFKQESQSQENKDKIMEMYEQYKDTYNKFNVQTLL